MSIGSEEADSTRRATPHSKINGNGTISAAICSTSSPNSNEFHRKFVCGADKTAEVNKKQNGKIGREKPLFQLILLAKREDNSFRKILFRCNYGDMQVPLSSGMLYLIAIAKLPQ